MCKIAHFYWGGGPYSFLRYLTIKSFMLHNPDWEVRFYIPKSSVNVPAQWVSHSHKLKYMGNCYLNHVERLGAKIVAFDFDTAGFPYQIHEAYRSDFLRWYLLYTVGGFWSDTDVIFYRGVTEDIFNNHDWCITADFDPTVYYIAYIYASKGSPVAGTIMRAAMNMHNFDPTNYQCLGNVLVKKCFPTRESYGALHPDTKIYIHDPVVNLPIKRIKDIDCIFEKSQAVNLSNSVGLHWYGGHPMAAKWEMLITPNVAWHVKSSLCELIKAVDICSL